MPDVDVAGQPFYDEIPVMEVRVDEKVNHIKLAAKQRVILAWTLGRMQFPRPQDAECLAFARGLLDTPGMKAREINRRILEAIPA